MTAVVICGVGEGKPSRTQVTFVLTRTHLVSLRYAEPVPFRTSRVVPFVRDGARDWLTNGSPARLKQLDRDLRSLTAYEGQMSSEIVYLHDATLGLINLDQDLIIKVFSIAAVLFLPPTVVGTIYGMNFEFMPELQWVFGYRFALVLMVLSAVLPYYWFRQKGWL